MPVWNSATHRWEQCGDPFTMLRRAATTCLLTAAELAEWESLCAWFLSWHPPAEPFDLGRNRCGGALIRVVDPDAWHRYYAERIREGVSGQVQRGIFAHLRLVMRTFGGNDYGQR